MFVFLTGFVKDMASFKHDRTTDPGHFDSGRLDELKRFLSLWWQAAEIGGQAWVDSYMLLAMPEWRRAVGHDQAMRSDSDDSPPAAGR